LSSTIVEKNPKRKRREKTETKEKKPDTKAETFRLYEEGRTLAEIAKERNLTVQTIEGHLAHFVETGAIKIESLVSREKIILIEPALKEFEKGSSLNKVKETLPSAIGYGDIKLVLAHLDYQKSSSHIDH
jgi:ATP-dependent DNA helicase RecQ